MTTKNLTNIPNDLANDIKIFEEIAEQTAKLAKDVVQFVIDVKTSNAINGVQDIIGVLKQFFEGAEEVEQDLNHLETPYLKEAGNAISAMLKKATDMIDFIIKETKETGLELVKDLEGFNFPKALEDLKTYFSDIADDVKKIIGSSKDQAALEDITKDIKSGVKSNKASLERLVENDKFKNAVNDFQNADIHEAKDSSVNSNPSNTPNATDKNNDHHH